MQNLQIPTYWGNYACIIPSIPEVLEVPANCLLNQSMTKLNEIFKEGINLANNLVSLRTMTNPYYGQFSHLPLPQPVAIYGSGALH